MAAPVSTNPALSDKIRDHINENLKRDHPGVTIGPSVREGTARVVLNGFYPKHIVEALMSGRKVERDVRKDG